MAIRRLSKLLAGLKHQAKSREKKLGKAPNRSRGLERLEDRHLMAQFKVQIDPQPGAVLDDTTNFKNKLSVAPTQLDFNFESFGSIPLPATVVTPQQQTDYLSQFIKIRRSGFDNTFSAPTATSTNDVLITPGFLGLGDRSTDVIMRFNEPLVDDLYRIEIAAGFKNSAGQVFKTTTGDATVLMDLELGSKVLAVVPQPVTVNATGTRLTQADKQVVVYFDKGSEALDKTSAENKEFYQFYATYGSLDTSKQVRIPSSQISSVVYDSTASTATITFLNTLSSYSTSLTPPVNPPGTTADTSVLSAADPIRAIRLRIGTDESARANIPVTVISDPDTSVPSAANQAAAAAGTLGPGWSFDTAYDAGSLSTAATGASVVFSQSISAQPYALAFPGGLLEPGHRNIAEEEHITGGNAVGTGNVPDAVADVTGGVVTQYYNFRDEIGIVDNARSKNTITPEQKQLAREIFDLYTRNSGIQFIERVNPKPLDNLLPNDPELNDIVVATGDLQTLGGDSTPGGVIGLAGTELVFGLRLALMDSAETWNTQSGDAPNENGNGAQLSWFSTAMHEIGHQLGLGHSYDLPAYTVQGEDGNLNTVPAEVILPGDADVVHIQHIARPDSKDIDMYKFTVNQFGTLNIETMAERLHDSSSLDTYLTLWRETTVTDTDPATGATIIDPITNQPVTRKVRELVGRNDDYYSKDSSLQITIDNAAEFGTYYVGVSAKGNDSYDPNIADSGIGGTTEGAYELRMDFYRNADSAHSIKDTAGTLLDGDADGTPGGASNFWFRVAAPMETTGRPTTDNYARTIFVEKTSTAANPNGSLARPFTTIPQALAVARPFDIIRIVGNGGTDNSIATTSDNTAYKVGFDNNGNMLEDGSALQVPKDVTVMIDAGAIFQLRQSFINVGSTAPGSGSDRSGSSLQVLGTPSQQVYFTSYNEQSNLRDTANAIIPTIGKDENSSNTVPAPGDWGGISFQSDIDRADGRFTFDSRGIFLNYVNYADIRYGGGKILVEGTEQTITPVRMVDSRPTVSNNVITASAEAAVGANPDSFEETNFHAPRFNPTANTRLNPDYSRIGPEIHGNTFVRRRSDGVVITNSLNGLFIRSATPGGGTLEELTVAGRFDDTDITHIISENLIVSGTPGGAYFESQAPTLGTVTATLQANSSTRSGKFTTANRKFEYRITYVDEFGNESPASTTISTITAGSAISPSTSQYIRLSGFNEQVPAAYVGRRVYRRELVNSTGVALENFKMVGIIPSSATVFNDLNITDFGLRQELLDAPNPSAVTPLDRARPDGSLIVDPRIIIKLDSSRIELEQGATMIAEGREGVEVIFTSLSDDRWGAGGTFDTRGDNNLGNAQAAAGNWAGIEARPDSLLSLDHVVVAYGGGTNRINGTATGINPVEILQADVRIANSNFEFNDNGIGGQSDKNRAGRGANSPGVVFVRGAQPVIVNNVFTNNSGVRNAVININVNALTSETIVDLGRQRPISRETANPLNGLTIDNDRVPDHWDNNGPLIDGNLLGNNTLNGMIVRGGTLTTEVIFDDTDIAHLLIDDTVFDNQTYNLYGQITVPDFHTYGGIRLESHIDESLVVKASGATAGLVATGRPLEIEDRIGGTVQVIGQPGFPVIMTGLTDDTASAGKTPTGLPQGDTDNNNIPLVLIPGPEVDTGLIIDNDLSSATPGYLSFNPQFGGIGGGANSQATVPTVGTVAMLQSFLNFVRVGNTTTALQNTTIVQTATRDTNGDDIVTSSGSFPGSTGQLITWKVTSRINPAKTSVINTINFTSSTTALGDLKFVNSMDANVNGAADILYSLGGAAGTSSFRLATLSNAGRYGLAQGGAYSKDGTLLANATWDGYAADTPAALGGRIVGSTQTFSTTGNVTGLAPVVDPILGNIFGPGDVSSAMSWTMDTTAKTATITTYIDLVPTNPVNAGRAGEWQGITLNQYSNDRNVETIVEQELDSASATERNGTSDRSQFIGSLAKNQSSGDENLRLGFTIDGTLRSNSDQDVYTFYADAGTEVWIDLDRTTMALDTVVEIIDDADNKLFLSDNSTAESAGAEDYYEGEDYDGQALRMQKNAPFNGQDFYTTNPRDAGLRVKLFGPAGQHLYHVRVRSANPNVKLPTGNVATDYQNVDGVARGQTKGAYQLQIRLQETDEVGGSTIRFADLRNATIGVNVIGLPTHSPLTGEAGEVPNENNTNDTRANATNVGNVLTSDRNAININGVLGGLSAANSQGRNDVDWYQFDVTFDALQMAGSSTFPLEIDADFASGLGRPDIQLYLYDSTGRLIAFSQDSNVSDDRSAPGTASGIGDLSRGSIGSQDALLGPIGVPTGRYYLAVTNPGATSNAFNSNAIRREPLNSIEKIVEDNIEDFAASPTTFETAQVTDLLDNDGGSAIPFHLGDVKLFVAQERDNGALTEASRLYMVNPYTGSVETEVRNANGSRPFNIDVGDIAFNGNTLYTYELDEEPRPNDPIDDAEAGRFYTVDTGIGNINQIGSDGIKTYELDATGAPVDAHLFNGARIGWGIQFKALAFGAINGFGTGTRMVAVGERGDVIDTTNTYDYIPSRRNILYQMNPTNGAYTGSNVGIASRLPPDEAAPAQNFPPGAYTDQLEVGEIPTQPILSTFNATQVNGGGLNNFVLTDGQQIIVDDGAGQTTYEFDSGPEIQNNASFTPNNPTGVGNTIEDGDFFLIDPTVDDPLVPATLTDETLIQFDTGTSLVVNFACTGSGVGSRAADYDTQTISITSNTGAGRSFEFDTNSNQLGGGTLPVVLGVGLPSAGGTTNIPACNLNAVGVASALATAINAANFGVTATPIGNRVSLVGDNGVGSTLAPVTGSTLPLISSFGSTGFAPVLRGLDAASITAGQNFSFRLRNGNTFRYFFTKNGVGTGTGTAVPIFTGNTAAQVASAIQTAISNDATAQGFLFAKVVNDKVVVNGVFDPTRVIQPYNQGSSPIQDLTATGNLVNGAFKVDIEESYPLFIQPTVAVPAPLSVDYQLQNVINTQTSYVVGADLNRLNFPDFSQAPFNTVANGYLNKKAVNSIEDFSIQQWQAVNTSATGVTGNGIVIPFLANDGNDAFGDPGSVSVGDRIAAAVNFNQPTLNAVATADRVTLLNGSISIPGVVNNPTCAALRPANQFYSCGEGPGGNVTGVANLRGELYAVTDRGGLYHITPNLNISDIPIGSSSLIPNNFVATDYIGYADDLNGIEFQGLTPGPQNTEGGRYANMLFAIDTDGNLYALNVAAGADQGKLMPIFEDGAVSIATGVTEARGLAFTSLDSNQWHVTPDLPASTERQLDLGHGINVAFDGSRNSTQGRQSYHFSAGNYPGGAFGSVISNEFSLKGYSALDLPTMYFNYFADGGNLDEYRVSVSSDSGDWQSVLLTTTSTGAWRQVSASLSGFVGLEHLRVRLDYVTGGDLDVGNPDTHGDEIYAVPGRQINDGETLVLADETFEFNSGYSLRVPTGRQIQANETLRVAGTTSSFTFTFIKTGTPLANQILILDTDTPRMVATKIATAINSQPALGITPVFGNTVQTTVENDNVLNLSGAAGVQLSLGLASQIKIDGQNDFRVYTQEGIAMIDGESITINDGNPAHQPLIFEFNNTLTPNAPVNTGANVVYVAYQPTQDSATIAANLRAAIATAVGAGRLTLTVTVNSNAVRLQGALLVTRAAPAGSAVVVAVDGTNFGNVRVPIDRSMTRIQVATALRLAMNNRYVEQTMVATNGSNLSDGMTFSLDDGIHLPVTYEFDTGFVLQIPVNGGAPTSPTGTANAANTFIAHGDQFRVSDGTNTLIVQFDKGGAALPTGANIITIKISNQSTQSQIARLVSDAISVPTTIPLTNLIANLGLDGTLMTNGRVQLGGAVLPTGAQNPALTFTSTAVGDKFGAAVSPLPGVGLTGTIRNQRIFVQQTAATTAADVILLVQAAIQASNANLWFNATVDAQIGNRLDLLRLLPEVQTIRLTNNTSPLVLQAKGTLVKGYRDLTYAIGHDVIDAGPLGLEDQLLSDPQDPINPGNPDPGINNDLGNDAAHFVQRGQDNAHEGAYIDDIMVGFAERGQMLTYTGAQGANDTFTVSATPVVNAEGPYSIEIRRSAVYGTPIQQLPSIVTGDDMRTFNTNDRIDQSLQLTGRSGGDIADGQTFTLGDGVNYVTFEFDDFTNLTSDGVTQGNIGIRFSASDSSDAIANKIRDAINSDTAKSVLALAAATSDGLLQTQVSTDNKVNIHGASTLTVNRRSATEKRRLVDSANVVRNLEDNDYAGNEEPIDILSSDRPVYLVNGTIGDRTALNNASQSNRDVDLYSIDMTAGQRIYVDLDAANLGSSLDTTLRIFSKNGSVYTPLLVSTNNAAPGETVGTDSYLEFIAPTSGTYIIGVSAGANSTYIPTETGTHPSYLPGGSTGTYQMEVISSFPDPNNPGKFLGTTLPSSIGFTVFNDTYGDDNRKRDQGAVLIHDNFISNMLQWGVVVDAGPRTAADGNQPHPGSVRQLSAINDTRLVPGIVISDNVISKNTVGGIRYSGDNVAGNAGPVSFGRIVNNTLYGRGGTLANGNVNDVGIQVDQNASPTLMNNIVANFNRGLSVDASSATAGRSTVVQYSVFQGNTQPNLIGGANSNGDFASMLALTDPLFVNAAKGNFYLQKLSQAVDSASKSLLDRTELTRVRDPLGISQSPIIAPETDIYGQKRVDDRSTSTPEGVGDNNFTDRGAVERADFFGPNAKLVVPLDNGIDDRDNVVTSVALPSNFEVRTIQIQLFEQDPTTGAATGTGIDDSTVNSGTVILRDISDPSNPRVMAVDTDFTFSYDATNNIITLTAVGGVFASPKTYEVELDINNGNTADTSEAIKDLAGNLLVNNRVEGGLNVHKYTIAIGSAVDFGDAPSTYQVQLDKDGARHESSGTFRLGTATTTLEADGKPSANATGDGVTDDGISNMTWVINGISSFTAVANGGGGKLDVWLDLNNNGTWDTNEKVPLKFNGVLDNTLLDGVPKTFTVDQSFMKNALGGTTFARFRLSTAGTTTPTGLAPDGEVEDYQLNIVQPPFRNPYTSQFDVDNNGIVESLDLLWMLYLFQSKGTSSVALPSIAPPFPNVPIPSVPPLSTDRFYDVDGNNVADTNDLLLLIDAIIKKFANGESPAVASGESPAAAPAVVAPRVSLRSASAVVAASTATTSTTVAMANTNGTSDTGIPATIYAATNIVVEENTTVVDESDDNALLLAALVGSDNEEDLWTTDLAADAADDFVPLTNSAEEDDLLDLLAGDQFSCVDE